MKKILALLLAALTLLSAVACGTVSEPKEAVGSVGVPADDLIPVAGMQGGEKSENEEGELMIADSFATAIASEDTYVRSGSYANQSM